MSLPPVDSANFEREVDENYRRDKIADFGKTYGKWIALAVVVFLAVVGALIFWKSEQKRVAGEQSEELAKVMADLGSGKTDGVDTRLEAIAKEGEGVTRATALMTEAATATGAGDRAKAAAIYGTIAGDDSLPKPYRDLATVRQAMIEFDTAEPADIVARLQPLAKPGEDYFGSAGELTAAALLKMGREEEAGQLFARLAAEPGVPQSIKSRAAQMASSLGVKTETPAATDSE